MVCGPYSNCAARYRAVAGDGNNKLAGLLIAQLPETNQLFHSLIVPKIAPEDSEWLVGHWTGTEVLLTPRHEP